MTKIKLLLVGIVLLYFYHGFKHRADSGPGVKVGLAQASQSLGEALSGEDPAEGRVQLAAKEKALEAAIEHQRDVIGKLYQVMAQLPPERMEVVQYCCGKTGYRKTESGLTGVQSEVNTRQRQIEALEQQLKRTREQLASQR